MPEQDASNQAGPPVRGRILLVDDDTSLLAAMERALKTAGYAVFTDADPEHALTHFEASPVDLIVTDCQMPGMSGPALIERVSRISPSTKALLISGGLGEAARDIHAPFLEKPFTPTELLAAVQRLLAGENAGSR